MVFPTLRRDPLARCLPRGDDGPVAGVECEYRLLDENGRPADARVHLTPLLADVPHLDPGDPRAVRLPLGSALTCDGWEAEAVTPPLPWGPEVAREPHGLRRRHPGRAADHPVGGDPVGGSRCRGGVLDAPERDRARPQVRDHRSRPGPPVLCGDGAAVRRPCRRRPAHPSSPWQARSRVRPPRGRMLGPAVVLLVGVVGLLQHRRSRLPRLDVTVRPAREKFGHHIAATPRVRTS